MKYRFDKTFPLLIKKEKNTVKPYFGPDFGLLGPNLNHKISQMFLEVSDLLDIKHRPRLQSCAISRKTNDANLRKLQKT